MCCLLASSFTDRVGCKRNVITTDVAIMCRVDCQFNERRFDVFIVYNNDVSAVHLTGHSAELFTGTIMY